MINDTYVTVWECDSSYYTVFIEEEPRIDAAVSEYMASGCTRDSLLDLRMTDGKETKVRVSRIASWSSCTPETRKRNLELGEEERAEKARMKEELHIWEDTT